MNKDNYITYILEELNKFKDLQKESLCLINFYESINMKNNEEYFDAKKNLNYANKNIMMLKNIIYLPIYEHIKHMSSINLAKYKDKLITEKEKEISECINLIQKNTDHIKELEKKLDALYQIFRRNTDNKEFKNPYIKQCKDYVEKIKKLKQELNELDNKIKYSRSYINSIKNKQDEEIKQDLLIRYNLLGMKEELENNRVTRNDEIIFNLCKDSNVLDEIVDNIRKYLELRDYKIERNIEIPKVLDDYKLEKNSNITKSIISGTETSVYDKHERNIKISNPKEIEVMIDNLRLVKDKITTDKNDLLKLKIDVEKLNEINLCSLDDNLINEITKLCDGLYLSETNKNDINKLYKKYKKTINKEKKKTIKHSVYFKINNIYNDYWEVLCNELECISNNIKHDNKFYNNLKKNEFSGIIKRYDIKNELYNNGIIFDADHFSEMGLFNMRVLIEKLNEKYSNLISEIVSTINELDLHAEKMIEEKYKKEEELIKIYKTINELYFKVSPNDFPLLIENYENIFKTFKENGVSDSLARVNRKNIISKIRSEIAKQTNFDINNLDNKVKDIEDNKKVLKQ